MSQLLRVGLILGAVCLAGVVIWQFALREDPRPEVATVEGVQETVRIGWTDTDAVRVEVDAQGDVFAALGYAHGMERAWPTTLWRLTALGRLSTWFGAGTLPLDRHARRLGLAAHARAAFRALPPADQRRLRAYTRGLNAALSANRVQREAPFVLLASSPPRWEPWHPLAVERLFAWLATDEPDVPADAPPSLRRFAEVDRTFRRWLHLHGFERSIAWTARRPGPMGDSTRTLLFQRHVWGAAATPVLQEITLQTPDAPVRTLVTVPGTLLIPGGTDGGRAWTLLLSSSRRITRQPVDTTRSPRFERISLASGDETLLAIPQDTAGLPFLPPSGSSESPVPASGPVASRPPDSTAVDSALVNAPPSDAPSSLDSLYVLEWAGLDSGTDLHAGLVRAGLAQADSLRSGSFSLFRGDGLTVSPAGSTRVTGAPEVQVQTDTLTAVGRSNWVRAQAEALRQRLQVPSARSTGPAAWTARDSSAWAGALLPDVLPALAPYADGPPLLRQARTYLLNWDRTYTRASIGASIFDAWMRAYRREIGHVPNAPDTTYFADHRRRATFRAAVDTLATRFGPDLSQWRWERTAPDRRFFPVWSADSLVAQDLSGMARTEYAPVDRPGRGHPSALPGGPSLVDPTRPAPSPAAWEGWTNPERTALTARRLRLNPAAFLARPLLQGARPRPVAVTRAPVTGWTTLTSGTQE